MSDEGLNGEILQFQTNWETRRSRKVEDMEELEHKTDDEDETGGRIWRIKKK